jgi:hypothetical protein
MLKSHMTEQRNNVILNAAIFLCAKVVEPVVDGVGTGMDYLREHHIYRAIEQARRISEKIDSLLPTDERPTVPVKPG